MADKLNIDHYIDQPTSWSLASRCLIVRGWCFPTDSARLEEIRLRSGDFHLFGVLGYPRPDVSAALPHAPHAHTGFEIRGTLPPGRHTVQLEARVTLGGWVTLEEHACTVPARFRPLWLGGGHWTDLMFFQMPTAPAYAPIPVQAERFPRPRHARAVPKLSIVTPSYNQAAYLPDTMRSVLDQPVPVEYVVQDGGSTDQSPALIQAQAPRLHAWASARDAGQADAICQGFKKTSGGPDDLMAWINSDDFYLPDALDYVADYFARHPEVDVIYGHRIVVDAQSQEIARWFLPRHDPAVLRLNDFVPQETLFWRRRIWDQVGGVDPSYQFAMDWDLLLRFDAAGAVIRRVPYFLACFRVHAVQKTAAAMHSIGQTEIDRLRSRAQGRTFAPVELEQNPTLLRYLRKSAFIEFLWRKLGWRAP